MRKYKDIPNWWFHLTLLASFLLALALSIFMKDEVQMPWWALIFAAGLALIFTLPISIITATTNQASSKIKFSYSKFLALSIYNNLNLIENFIKNDLVIVAVFIDH